LRPAAEVFDAYAEDYDAALEQGIRLAGETRDFFSRGRVAFTSRALRRLGAHDGVRRILDYGCGTGDTSLELLHAFPCLEVVGLDASPAIVASARSRIEHPAVRFDVLRGDSPLAGGFDLAFVSNVFHHVEPDRRSRLLAGIRDALRPGGHLAFFENNPWNPGARAVMARVPFDRDAVPLSVLEALRRVRDAGLEPLRTGSLFYFPRFLAALRFLEPCLGKLPFGAQYVVIARRPLESRSPE
jgi:SAM-dependent methyltransferase